MAKRLFQLIALALFIPALAAGVTPAKPRVYLAAGEPDLTLFLAPPSAPDSAETRLELQEMLALQSNRTPAMVQRAWNDQAVSVFLFDSVLGTNFQPKNFPEAAAFFAALHRAADVPTGRAKARFHRARPYETEAALKPCLVKPGKGDSYPSGHAVMGCLFGILLADMLPERAAEIHRRAWEFSRNRVIGGVHYPSDVEAGRISAALLAMEMFRNPDFRADFETAKAEIRKVFGQAMK